MHPTRIRITVMAAIAFAVLFFVPILAVQAQPPQPTVNIGPATFNNETFVIAAGQGFGAGRPVFLNLTGPAGFKPISTRLWADPSGSWVLQLSLLTTDPGNYTLDYRQPGGSSGRVTYTKASPPEAAPMVKRPTAKDK